MRKYYIITFDRDEDKSYGRFHDDFVAHPNIKGKWFHYIKSSYIVGTTLSANEISKHFIKTALKYGLSKDHLVISINLRYRQGWLHEDAWGWLKRNRINQQL